jgi:kinesin family protein 3/17
LCVTVLGCGKTFSMIGDPTSDVHKGIIPRAFEHIVKIISSASAKNFLVRCSFLEIYNEEVHDLLGKGFTNIYIYIYNL